MEPYHYEALPQSTQGSHYFRLLEIFPSTKKDEPVKVHLRTFRLEDKPTYECLSYVWGTSSDDYEVLIEGENGGLKKFKIRKNLNDALRALRHASERCTLWTDALCINEADHEERNSQVALMGLLYWSASRVNIWLGQDPRGVAKAAFDAIKPISAAHWRNDGSMSQFSQAQADALDPTLWRGVTELYQNPWFGRVWVQQELGLSKEAYFYWGDAPPVDVRDVFGFDIWMERTGDVVRARFIGDASTVRGSRNLWLQYSRVTRSSSLADDDHSMATNSFLQILVDGSNCTATDPRDHVYAFLGHPAARRRNAYENDLSVDYWEMCNSASQTIVAPDYKKTTEEVYLEVAEKLLLQHNDLRLLGAVSHSDATIKSDFPSWAPRWNANQHRKTIGTWPGGWPTKIEVVAVPSMHIHENALRVQGLIISAVSSLLRWSQGSVNSTLAEAFRRNSNMELLYGRRIFQTRHGHKGIVQNIVQAGDDLVLLVGAYSPCILRHIEDTKFKLVGNCMMFDLQDDQLNKIINDGQEKIQEIILI
ncbi:hypothetical protein F5Y05DRAFT_422837 [Hypoxylon sp. FL0543]|nr:hypothetical protein F5Y05DRAFT_422837 [Hypoxylon sp. FL0543]